MPQPESKPKEMCESTSNREERRYFQPLIERLCETLKSETTFLVLKCQTSPCNEKLIKLNKIRDHQAIVKMLFHFLQSSKALARSNCAEIGSLILEESKSNVTGLCTACLYPD